VALAVVKNLDLACSYAYHAFSSQKRIAGITYPMVYIVLITSEWHATLERVREANYFPR